MNIFRLLWILMMLSTQLSAQEFNVMSFNIRYNNPHDNENWWGHRKEAAVQLIKDQNPIVFGVQEAIHSQMMYLDKYLPEYHFIGVGRDDGKEEGEYSAIFYHESLTPLNEGTFWLSQTPNEVSKDWDAALPRICTYGEFKLDERTFWVFNTHFDHRGVQAREESAKLIVSKIKEITEEDDTVILTGDFNTTSDKAPYFAITNYMLDGAKASQSRPEGPKGTFSGFDKEAELKDRIDYIFFRNAEVKGYSHLDTKRPNGLWISDHLPVLMRVKIED